MSPYKPGRPDWVPITVFILGMTLAAVALAVICLAMQGVTFR